MTSEEVIHPLGTGLDGVQGGAAAPPVTREVGRQDPEVTRSQPPGLEAPHRVIHSRPMDEHHRAAGSVASLVYVDAHLVTARRPRSMSAIRSSGSSRPTDIRIEPSSIPAASSASSSS